MYCSEKCRYRSRYESAKFRVRPPRSGIPGISFNRFANSWVIHIKIDGKWKYIGSDKTLEGAITFKKLVDENT